jgi:signal transduction histidine kinase
MEGILLDAERRATTPHREALEKHLRMLENRALSRLAESARTPNDVADIESESSLFRVPFFIDEDGRITAPTLRPTAPGRTWADDEPPPLVYLNAVRTVHAPGDLDEKRRALESLVGEDEIAPRWQVRALTQLAAVYRRQNQSKDAARVLERIFAEFDAILPALAWPTFLQLSLVEAETIAELKSAELKSAELKSAELKSAELKSAELKSAELKSAGLKSAGLERGERASAAIRRGLRHLSGAERNTTLSEEEFFLRGCSGLIARLHIPIAADTSSALQRAQEAVAAERMSYAALENARDRIRSTSTSMDTDDEPHRIAAQFGKRLIPVVWRAVGLERDRSTKRTVAVGFQIDPPTLAAEFERWLDENAPDAGLHVSVSDASAQSRDIIPLLPLSGDLDFVTLGKDLESWENTLGGARRPFVLAAILISGLGLILVAGLLFFYRGVRREMILARMKTEFVANVSHELKTPLALIRLCSETLELDRLPDKSQRMKYYEIITRESERLTHLIGNVLNFASIEAGKKTYTLEPRDLAPMIRETSEAYFLQFREKGFECSHDIPHELPQVLADDEAVAQALINLLQNAVRYSPDEKSVVVRASVDGKSLRISVRDRGVGIAAEDQERIWEDYYRTKSARALGTRGSGLGLSLVQHIVKAHDGEVELDSKPGEGSEFTLVLPVAHERTEEV